MKRGIFSAFLVLFCLSTVWGEVIEDTDVWPSLIKKDRKEVMELFGKIEFNLDLDGSVKGRDLQVFETDEAIKNYIVKSKDEFVAVGKDPILHLKGATNPKFNSVRRVLTIANDIGVNRMICSLEMGGIMEVEIPKVPKEKPEQPKEAPDVFESRLKSLVEDSIKPRKEDLGMSLPGNKPLENAKDVFIHLNAQGQVYLGKEKLAIDQDADNREMPLLKAELVKLKADGKKLAVTIYVDPAAKQQRVIDLLNTLAAVDISTVTFSDEIDK